MERWEVETTDKAPTGRRSRFRPKGNTFECGGIGVLSPKGAYGDTVRPHWASFVCEDGSVSPIVANIRMGRKVSRYRYSSVEAVMEFLRSTPYDVRVQRLGDGLSSVVVYRPELFHFNPGPVESGETLIEYVVLPDAHAAARLGLTETDVTRAWESARNVPMPGESEDGAQELERYPDEDDRDFEDRRTWARKYAAQRREAAYPPIPEEVDREYVLRAALSGAFLDHRTHCPLLPDLGFLVYLLRVLRAHGLAHIAGETDDRGYGRAKEDWRVEDGLGYLTPLMVSGTPVGFATAIAEAVRDYIPNE